MPHHPITLPEMPGVTASEISAPPAWALMQRNLIDLMNEAAPAMFNVYTEQGGALLYPEDLDDLYEQFYNWGLFYAIGGDRSIFDMALQGWNATTRISDESFMHRTHHNEFKKTFNPSIHREFWNLAQSTEWHHLSEGNMALYDFGVANPTISENVRRARRFAGFFIGDDPDAPNYDPVHKILRSPFHSSQGPRLEADVEFVHTMLLAGRGLGGSVNYYGVRASLYPIVKDLELDWYENPTRRAEIIDLFNRLVLNCDTPNSLAATALVTHAYLNTGDEKYKKWVLEYTEAWMDRMRRNNGIMPDNVGPNGIIGEDREGVWWGGQYGWNHYQGFNIMFHGLNIAAECCLLLTGDYGYLDLLRSQINLLLDHSIKRADGQLLHPTRYGPDGWCYDPPDPPNDDDIVHRRNVYTGPMPWRMQELTHLYHASMSDEDYGLITRIREGEVERDWNDVGDRGGEKNSGQTEFARFQYYDGKNPDWPVKIMTAEYNWALENFEKIRTEQRTLEQLIVDNVYPPNPVFTKGLTQVAMGAPQSIYNGGLLRATVRYFDPDHARPGLPDKVAALVDSLGSSHVGIQLVNLDRNSPHNLIVQAGAFGEHTFKELHVQDGDGEQQHKCTVNGKYVTVALPPSTTIRLRITMDRFVNDPSYVFPWHGDTIPVPFPQ